MLSLALALGTCASRASLTEYQAAVRSEPSLISYYTFDAGNARDTKAANHGTVSGNATYDTGAGGGADRALVLNGTGHVNLGQVDAFDFLTGTGSVEAWIRADWTSSPGYNPAIFADRDGGPVNWSVHLEASKAAGGLWNGSSYQPMAVPAPGTGWHHLVVVFDYDATTGASTFTLYWDGQLMGVREQALGITPEAPTQLGSSAPGGRNAGSAPWTKWPSTAKPSARPRSRRTTSRSSWATRPSSKRHLSVVCSWPGSR
ncbi:MAG: LamG domain-containing protein [Verrucomicrobia bacterium]|nr:LamG domain-containing protein [Verrucomicrobiota bacterium]